MKGILINDLLIFKKQAKIYLLFLVVFFGISFFAESTYLFGPLFLSMFLISGILGQYTNDTTSGWVTFCDCTPSKRDDFVKAKYVLFLSLISVLFVLCLCFYVVNPNLRQDGFYSYLYQHVLIISGAVCVMAVGIPLVFKFKKHVAAVFIAMIAGVFGGFGTILSINMRFAEPSLLAIVLCIAVSAVLMLASLKLSFKIFRKKEF